MKKFFESKQNRVIVAVTAAVIVLLTAVLVTVAVTRKRKTYEQAATEPSVEIQTEAPTVAESESETVTEPQTAERAPETSEKGTDTSDKSSKKSDKGKSDKDKSDNSGSQDKKPVINLGSIRLEGRWGTTESIAPSELFNGDFLAKTGFNKQLRASTKYQFNSQKKFSITYEILSSNDYVAAMREAYTAYFKEIYPEWTPEELEKRADQTAWQEFWEITNAVIGVTGDAAEVTGTYSNDETTIYYQCDGGWSFSETYVIKDKTLTLTGSSEGNDGYPIKLTRW